MAINEPSVSIVIPTHNRKKTVVRAIRSVLNQSYKNIECIVVDDESGDGTSEYISSYINDSRVVLIKNKKNLGAQASRNIGINASNGKYLILLDSDDYIEDDGILKRVKAMEINALDCLISNYFVEFSGKKWIIKKISRIEEKDKIFSYVNALRKIKIAPTVSLSFRNDFIREIGGLDLNLKSGHDDDLVLRSYKYGKCGYIDEITATLVQHIGDRVATDKNLAIGDFQIFLKYQSDILKIFGKIKHMKYLAKIVATLIINRQSHILISIIKFNKNNLNPFYFGYQLIKIFPLLSSLYVLKRVKWALFKYL